MEMMKNIECSRCFRFKGSAWPPADLQKLSVERDSVASALVESDMVDSVRVDDSEVRMGS